MGITAGVWVIQALRKKIEFKTPLNRWILAYLGAGFMSLLSAMFLIKTFPLQEVHIAKAFLHLLRYIEYFTLFFFAYAAIKKPADFRFLTKALLIGLVAVTVYGVGQRYAKWPVYSTMNWEFSSGEVLELANEHARVQSTFAGHYDFAIYLGILLPFVLALIYHNANRKRQLLLSAIFLMGLWGLIVSGLRIAFVSYLLSVTVLTVTYEFYQKKDWRLNAKWIALRLGAVYIVTAIFFTLFGSNLSALLIHAITGVTNIQNQENTIDDSIIAQYQLPVPQGQSAEITNTKPQDLSGCAKEKEISLCIRLESLWPDAIKGFARQPLLGSGYSTLNKRDFNHLSEADGVDNNYLRILGETGLLGFITFFGIVVCAVLQAKKQLQSKDFYFAVTYFAIVAGILLNATLFDVFAASKVAFIFWGVTGMMLGYWKLQVSADRPHRKK